MGEKRTPTSVRHVYDDSGEPSGLLLLCHCRHCFHPRWALAVAFRRPLARCPRCAIGGLRPLAPQDHRPRHAHATLPLFHPSRPPMPHPGNPCGVFQPTVPHSPNPQDRMPSPTRSTTPRHPSHVGFSQTCAMPLDTPTPCFPNHKWGAKEPLEGNRRSLAPFRFSQTRVRAMVSIHRHWPINDPPAVVSGVLP